MINTKLRAYHNDPALKTQVVALIHWHREQDRLIKGVYQDTRTGVFRGCAVGCTLRSLQEITGIAQEDYSVRARYETLIGVPQALAGVQDRLFETLPTPENQAFAVAFLDAIPVGADLSLVWPHLAVWLLTDPVYGVVQHLGEQRAVAERVADLYQQLIAGVEVTRQQWSEAKVEAHMAYITAAGDTIIESTSTRSIASTGQAVEAATNAAYGTATLVSAASTTTSIESMSFWRAFRDELLRVLAAAPLASSGRNHGCLFNVL